MIIPLKTSARRLMQTGAAFTALGALGLASAVPVGADEQPDAFASAHLAEIETFPDEAGYVRSDIGRIGSAGTASGTASGDESDTYGGFAEYLTVDGTTSVEVDDGVARATSEVESARILMTVDELIDDPASTPESPETQPSAAPEPPESPENEDMPEPGAPNTGAQQGEGDGDNGSADETEEGGDASQPLEDAPSGPQEGDQAAPLVLDESIPSLSRTVRRSRSISPFPT